MNTYFPKGVCSRQILFDIKNDIIQDVKFIGGCSGNLQGIARLVKGMPVDEAITRLKGIQCRNNTSCPDQFASALIAYKAQQNQ